MLDKLLQFIPLVAAGGIAWFTVWNHYNVILNAHKIKPTKWRGDDRIFGSIALFFFVWFAIIFFSK